MWDFRSNLKKYLNFIYHHPFCSFHKSSCCFFLAKQSLSIYCSPVIRPNKPGRNMSINHLCSRILQVTFLMTVLSFVPPACGIWRTENWLYFSIAGPSSPLSEWLRRSPDDLLCTVLPVHVRPPETTGKVAISFSYMKVMWVECRLGRRLSGWALSSPVEDPNKADSAACLCNPIPWQQRGRQGQEQPHFWAWEHETYRDTGLAGTWG